MTTAASLGIGTKVEYETTPGASPLAFTTVPEVLDLPELPNTRETVETTNQDSQDFTREFIPGLIDPQQFTFECNYLPNNSIQTAIWDQLKTANGGRRLWRVRETTSSPEITWTFEAFVIDFAVAAPVAGVRTVSITLQRTGAVTRA